MYRNKFEPTARTLRNRELAKYIKKDTDGYKRIQLIATLIRDEIKNQTTHDIPHDIILAGLLKLRTAKDW